MGVEEIGRSLEAIMKCEDFKSNFARKLSHRYSTRTSVVRESPLKLPNSSEFPPKVAEKTVPAQPPKKDRKPMKTPENTDSSLKNIEVNALNMEVETLRWQLSQTEVNRQMHIALLRQVVSFLSRVKEHIEYQKPQLDRKDSMSRLAQNLELPRSKSVVHVNKNRDFTVGASKKLITKKISKSISNVSGYKENGWIPTKLFSTPEEDSSLKITEEMTRLINLANSVLSTKLPDLASTCNEPEYASISETDDKSQNNDSASLYLTDEDITNAFILNTICDSDDKYQGIVEFESKNINMDTPPPIIEAENEYAEVKLSVDPILSVETSPKSQRFVDQRSEYANFIEDESGFSSMSSFQEIGIPIISIIPPSPCKEAYDDDIADILEEAKWKSTPVDLEKQSVKVFWV